VVSQLGLAESKRWFDFCYRFALCVKPCYLSPRVLNRCPHGSGTDILITNPAATFCPRVYRLNVCL
jgi:hypothetical protein